MELKEIKQDIESKFQVILTLSIFFPTTLLIFLQYSDMENKKIFDTTLSWSILVGLCIIDYVFFSCIKKSCNRIIILKWIYWSLIVGICLFIFPLVTLILHPNFDKFISYFFVHIYEFSLYGLLLAPCAVLIVMMISIIIGLKKK